MSGSMMRRGFLALCVVLTQTAISRSETTTGTEIGRAEVYSVVQLSFAGPSQGPADTPARDIELRVRFRHEPDGEPVTVYGFWDGDGRGGSTGTVFHVRFSPTRPGRWRMAEVRSNRPELNGQKQGDFVTAVRSDRKGFWEIDTTSPGHRWYRRSDGSHQYIFGNTHYTFLSGMRDTGPVDSDIVRDVRGNAEYFKKLRFSVMAGRYVNPIDKPFFDEHGRPTDNGDFSDRPNPTWFHNRVDRAVDTAFAADLIADLIIAGPDTLDSRATLRARDNGGDATPYLKYIAARYGSYPNVWICMCNEYDIKEPSYSERQIVRMGGILRGYLPYPTPVSVHRSQRDWPAGLNSRPPWNDHVIVQRKLRKMGPAADVMVANHAAGGEVPVVNDELSYQGAGDRHSKQDNIEAHLGAFLGGGYASGSYKPARKKGQYFWGGFDVHQHTAADNLKWFRTAIDRYITFWKMEPVALDTSIFSNTDDGYRAMAWMGHEYVLGTNHARKGIVADLPDGKWTVTRFDVIAKRRIELSGSAHGRYSFNAPNSRAILFHFRRNK